MSETNFTEYPIETYVDSRTEEIKKITQEIDEIHSMYSSFHELCKKQGKSIDTIDSMIENTKHNTQDANTSLHYAYTEYKESFIRKTKIIASSIALGGLGYMTMGIGTGIILSSSSLAIGSLFL